MKSPKQVKKNEDFGNIYNILSDIGRRPFQPSGSASYVALCSHKGTPDNFAVKVIQKKPSFMLKSKRIGQLLSINHRNIASIKELFDSEKTIYIVTELLQGPQLFTKLCALEHYSERTIAYYFRQLVEAVCHLHQYGIVHKNLKPENILLSSEGPDGIVKITDSCLGDCLPEDFDMELVCHNPVYCAPELLISRKYDKKFDIWSLGILLHILLCGIDPYCPKENGDLYMAILNGSLDNPKADWGHVSLNSKDTVNRMLVLDPALRTTTAKLLEHTWMLGKHNRDEHMPDVHEQLKQFDERRRVRNERLAGCKHHSRGPIPEGKEPCLSSKRLEDLEDPS